MKILLGEVPENPWRGQATGSVMFTLAKQQFTEGQQSILSQMVEVYLTQLANSWYKAITTGIINWSFEDYLKERLEVKT